MSSSANLSRRLSRLEGDTGMETYDPVLLLGPDDDAHERLAAHEAVHGKSGKEPFFVRLVGIKPHKGGPTSAAANQFDSPNAGTGS